MTVSGRAVAARLRWRSRSIETWVTSVPVRSWMVMLSTPPSRGDVHVLDAVEVHRDIRNVAEEADTGSVG